MNRFSRCVVLATSTASLFASAAFACDMHGEGMGAFGNFHPLAQKHFGMRNIDPTISIQHISTTQVNVGEASTLVIKYRVPPNYTNVNVNFAGSDSIEFLEQPKASFDKLSGSYSLKFQVAEKGTHYISLQIDALEGKKPFLKVQSVEVYAS